MKTLIGRKVRLKQSFAKWHLNHPDIYESARGIDPCYEEETLIHLACCLGEPILGIVAAHSRHSSNYQTYYIQFTLGRLRMSYWVERKHVEFL